MTTKNSVNYISYSNPEAEKIRLPQLLGRVDLSKLQEIEAAGQKTTEQIDPSVNRFKKMKKSAKKAIKSSSPNSEVKNQIFYAVMCVIPGQAPILECAFCNEANAVETCREMNSHADSSLKFKVVTIKTED